MSDITRGSCCCGAVKFQFEGKPGFRAQCFCRKCQYFAAGGPQTFIMVEKANFKLTEGELSSFSYQADSGNSVLKEFCGKCGVQMFSHVESFPQGIAIVAGTLEDPSKFPPRSVNWTQAAPAWAHFNPDIPQNP